MDVLLHNFFLVLVYHPLHKLAGFCYVIGVGMSIYFKRHSIPWNWITLYIVYICDSTWEKGPCRANNDFSV